MKRFMYLSIGTLCLMLAVVAGYHLGSQTAHAQTMETVYVGFATGTSGTAGWVVAIQPNGDVYRRETLDHERQQSDPPTFVGNYWWGTAVPVQDGTWGSIKAK